MDVALAEARAASARGEVPVGAVVLGPDGAILARTGNEVEAQAISFFRIRRVVFGAYDPKSGGVEHGARVFDATSCHHRPEVVGGVRESEAAALLRAFFADRR